MKHPLKIFLITLAVVLGGYGVARVCGWCESPAVALSKWRAERALEKINRSKDLPGKGNSNTYTDYRVNVGEALRKDNPNESMDGVTYIGIPVDELWYDKAQGKCVLTEENKEVMKGFFVGKHEILAAYIPSDSTRIGQVFDECICYICAGELFCESPKPTEEEYVWIDGRFTIEDVDKLLFCGTIKTKFKDVAGGREVAVGGSHEFEVYENAEYGVVCRLRDNYNEEDVEAFQLITIFLNKNPYAPPVYISEEEAGSFVGRVYNE